MNENKEKMHKYSRGGVYPGVDLAKFILSIFVVAIHTNALSFLPSAMDYMGQKLLLALAVPYFLIASGFFLGKKLQKGEEKRRIIKAYIFRLAKPLIVFELLCIVLTFVPELVKGNAIDILEIFHRVVCYPYGALWYLQAVIVSVLVLLPFILKNRYNAPLILGLCLYIIGLLCNGYYFLVEGTALQGIVDGLVAVFYRHNIFVALIYVAIGLKLANTKLSFGKGKFWLLLPAYGIYAVEVALVHLKMDGGNYYFTQLILIPLLFCLSLRIRVPRNARLSKYLRNYSTGIYLLHKAVVLPLIVLVLPTAGILQFFAVLAITVLFCTLVYRSKWELLCALLR